MSNKNKTLIIALLDKSGSMGSLRESTITGFNSFIKEQKTLDGEANVTLALFDTSSIEIYKNKDLRDVNPLVWEDYRPGGGTALYDALGDIIDSTGSELASLKEDERPNNVIVLIITDGEDNESRRFRPAQIKEKITHQESKYSWKFIFLGANIDVEKAATSIGINAFATYSADVTGTKNAYLSAGAATKSMRSVGYVTNDWCDALAKDQTT